MGNAMSKRTRGKGSVKGDASVDLAARRGPSDNDTELITRPISVAGIKIPRKLLRELMDVEFLVECLYWEGLLYILSVPELCAALRKRLEEPNRAVWAALQEHVNKPRLPPGRRLKWNKTERARQRRAEGWSLAAIGRELYPKLPKEQAKHNVDSLLRSGKKRPIGRIVAVLGGLPVYRSKD
jgi:hypothetical protein